MAKVVPGRFTADVGGDSGVRGPVGKGRETAAERIGARASGEAPTD